MNNKLNLRIDKDTLESLWRIEATLKISKSDIVRMAIRHFENYVKKVNK